MPVGGPAGAGLGDRDARAVGGGGWRVPAKRVAAADEAGWRIPRAVRYDSGGEVAARGSGGGPGGGAVEAD